MKHGLIAPNGEEISVNMYDVEGLCKKMLNKAIEDGKYKKIYEEKYQGKFTYFSEALEFCLHELGYMLYDPFVTGKEDVLFSNGYQCYVTSKEKALSEGFDRKSITRDDVAIKMLTDETVSYDRSLTKLDEYDDGIVNERGYVSAKFLGEDLNKLARIILLHEMIGSKELYDHFMTNRPMYTSALFYLTSFSNVIAVDRQDNGQFLLSFVSENDGRVLDFINSLTMSGKMANYDPAPIITK